MKILALDTSSLAASCAWMEDGNLTGEFFVNTSMTHSQTIMPMVESMMKSIGRSVEDADVLAVSCGPGSFTGLRIGMAAVKGMALVTGKPCAAVSTLWALAINLTSFRGHIVPVMDARRQQVYTALFHSDGQILSRLSEDRALSLPDLHESLLPVQDIMLVGDGSALCRDYLAKQKIEAAVAPSEFLHQRAASVCVAAGELALQKKLVDASDLQPVYLRLPQAERERLEREEWKG